MSWTTPRTWIPGETVTASLMNVHVRDDLNALKTDTETALAYSTDIATLQTQVLRRFELLFREAADHATSGTGATDVYTYALTGGKLQNGEVLHYVAEGDMTSDGNTKTWLLKVGSDVTTITSAGLAASSYTQWKFEVEIHRISASSHRINAWLTIGTTNVSLGVMGAPGYGTLSVNLDNAANIILTLTHATSGSTTARMIRAWIERP